jgi:hypothetical protein
VIQTTFANEGISGFYRGLTIAVVGSGPATCLYLTTYDVSQLYLKQQNSYIQFSHNLAHFLSGFIAETVSCVFWVPIDVIKERLQVQSHKGGGYRNTIHALQTIARYEGIRGIYKGYSSTILSFGPFSAFMFMFFEQFKKCGEKFCGTTDLSFSCSLLCSAMAATLAALITNPLDLVKLRLQIQRRKLASSTSHTASLPSYGYTHFANGLLKVLQEEGVRALYKGAFTRMMFSGSYTALSLSLYEQLKKFITSRS